MRSTRLLSVILLLWARVALAEVSLPKVIGDNMILQRDRAIPIWGKASAGETVKVHLASQEKTATADADGNWRIILDAMSASSSPLEMSITGPANSIQLKNILVGEVWLCSGQSNMEFPMHPVGNFSSQVHVLPKLDESLAASAEPQIRFFKVEKNLRDFTTRGWTECKPDTADKFSAVGYFFAKELHDELKIPIGMMQAAWGGTRIEPWTPAEAYEADPIFKSQATSKPVTIDTTRAGTHFNAMVRPIVPFAMRGVLWYQGESNLIYVHDRDHYFDKFKTLVDSWRSLWNQGDFPFYYVQIAPLAYSRRRDQLKHSVEDLPVLWEAQSMSLKIPNTGMASTMDLVENFTDIHPADKWNVAHRLALIALAKDYGRKQLVYSGPMFKAVEFKDGMARVSFDHAANGLASRDSKPFTDFAMAGADGKFQPASAALDGQTVVLSNPAIPDPKFVRFGWTETAQPNLMNKEGLPAIPFRTDHLPVAE